MEYKNNTIKTSLRNEDGTFYGYASIFNVTDSYNDVIINGAFKDTLINNKEIQLCWQHDSNKVIGKFNIIKEDDIGLYVEGKIDINNNKNIYSYVKNELVNGLSIGYTVNNCYTDKKGRRVLTSINLKEISIVSFPVNKHSNIIYCKSNNSINYLQKCINGIDKLINIFKY